MGSRKASQAPPPERDKPNPSTTPLPRRSAADMVADGMELVQASGTDMVKMARLKPRDEKEILKGLLAELVAFDDLAEKVYYRIPRFRHARNCRKPKNAKGDVVCGCPRTITEGVSAKASRNLVRRWGNLISSSLPYKETEHTQEIICSCIDLETNYQRIQFYSASKFGVGYDGKPYKLGAQQLDEALQRAAAKGQRNVELAVLPYWIVETYFETARSIVRNRALKGGLKEAIPACRKAFGDLGVKAEVLDDYCDRQWGYTLDQCREEEVLQLRELLLSIKNGDVKVAEAFAAEPQQNGNYDLDPDQYVTAGEVTVDHRPSPESAGDNSGVAQQFIQHDVEQHMRPKASPGRAEDLGPELVGESNDDTPPPAGDDDLPTFNW